MKLKMLGTLLSILLLIPVTLMASDRDSRGIDIVRTVKVGGTMLEPGHYKVTWSGNGEHVQVRFVREGRVVAAAPARLVWRNNGFDDAVETETTPDNSQAVQALDWKKMSLLFEATGSSAGN